MKKQQKVVPITQRIYNVLKEDGGVVSAAVIAGLLGIEDHGRLYTAFCVLVDEGRILKSRSGYRLPGVDNIE